MNFPSYFAESDGRETAQIRKVARLAACSFALASAAYSANGGNIAKAVKVAKAEVAR